MPGDEVAGLSTASHEWGFSPIYRAQLIARKFISGRGSCYRDFSRRKSDGAMILHYYPNTDMLHIKLVDKASTESEEVASGAVLDFDAHNQVVGIEIEDASKHIDLSRLELLALPLTNLILSEKELVKS
jgi:uncharacterized protein YuzE